MNRTYVVAPSYQAFKDWCFRRNIDENVPIFVSRPDQVKGARLSPDRIKLLPGVERMEAWPEINKAIRKATSKGKP